MERLRTGEPATLAASPALRNKHLVTRIVEEVLNQGNHAAADELIARDYVEHSPLPGQAAGLAGLKVALLHFRVAFPDFRLAIDDLIAEGDRVVVRATASATHRGGYLGIPASGRRVRWTAIDIIRLSGGRQVEHWGNHEALDLLDQICGRHTALPDAANGTSNVSGTIDSGGAAIGSGRPVSVITISGQAADITSRSVSALYPERAIEVAAPAVVAP